MKHMNTTDVFPWGIQERFEPIGTLTSFERDGDVVVLCCGSAKIRISLLEPDIARVRLSKDGRFGPDYSWAVVKNKRSQAKYTLRDQGSHLEIRTNQMSIRVMKSPCRIAFYSNSGELISEDFPAGGMGWQADRVKCWKTMPYDEHYFGFGEKTGSFDKRRQKMVMWNVDAYGYDPTTDPMYKSIPFFIAVKKGKAYGIFFDNTYKTEFDMGNLSEEWYSFGAEGGELNYYFFLGPGIKKILQNFTELTGRMPIPPRWALGNHQARNSYYPEARVLEIADKFRSKDIPLDVLWLDAHFMDDYEVFTWDNGRFPDPKAFMSKMKERGMKVVVLVDHGVKADCSSKIYQEGIANNYFCNYRTGEVFYGRMWPGVCAFPDFTNEKVRKWWGDLHKDLIEAGVDGIWNDMNEPTVFPIDIHDSRDLKAGTIDSDVVHYDRGLMTPHAKSHNVYALLECQGTYEGLLRLNPNKRPFILSRAGSTGIQRYAAVWTGDNTANWDHLALQIPMFLNLGLSGVHFVGSDIGGLVPSSSPELLTRWYQICAFVAFCRNHSVIKTYDKECWVFGDYYTDIIRKYLKLRYSLIPYLYTCLYEHWEKGSPLLRPLIFEYQEDENTLTIQDEFLVGENLLVAPIIKESTSSRLVYLPKGTWTEYETGTAYTGPCYMKVEAPLDKIPIFVKAGSIIPMQPDMNYVDEKPIDPLILDVYPSDEISTYTLYEDDGYTMEYQNGNFCLTRYECKRQGDKVKFTVRARVGGYSPPQRSYWIRLNRIEIEPIQIAIQRERLEKKETVDQLEGTAKGWTYDPSQKKVHIRITDRGTELKIVIS